MIFSCSVAILVDLPILSFCRGGREVQATAQLRLGGEKLLSVGPQWWEGVVEEVVGVKIGLGGGASV